MDSVFNSFNKNTRAKVYDMVEKKTRTMKLSGLYSFGEYGKHFKLNLVRVLAPRPAIWSSVAY